MRIVEQEIKLDWTGRLKDFKFFCGKGKQPIRLVANGVDGNHLRCSISMLRPCDNLSQFKKHLFACSKKPLMYDDKFNVVLTIPTGLGASVGGHAGDAGAVARLFASVCDTLITHPNVVNASDFNEMTDNTLYVEGYALTQYMLGQIGLQRVRQNRVLVVIDGSAEQQYIDATINVVNAARATYGFNCTEIVVLNPSFKMKAEMSEEGRATGIVDNLDELYNILSERKGLYDAVALSSLIEISQSARDHYYNHGGVNPWGGVEAMLTHAISYSFGVPCAHAPMMESVEVEQTEYGVIDPRDGAEIVSVTYLPCVLKGLNRAPRLCEPDVHSIADASCLVMPRMCLGLPALAACERGIPIIAVNDQLQVEAVNCTDYVFAIVVDNYIEAAGVVAALRTGISVESLRRPLEKVKVSLKNEQSTFS